MLRRNNADRELGCRPIVRAIESDGSYGVAAKSSLSSLAQPLACTLNHLFVESSAADLLPVQNGPETVGLDTGDVVSGVGLRLGGIAIFCCSLSRLAAVQGSSLIVSLPRFVCGVERSNSCRPLARRRQRVDEFDIGKENFKEMSRRGYRTRATHKIFFSAHPGKPWPSLYPLWPSRLALALVIDETPEWAPVPTKPERG